MVIPVLGFAAIKYARDSEGLSRGFVRVELEKSRSWWIGLINRKNADLVQVSGHLDDHDEPVIDASSLGRNDASRVEKIVDALRDNQGE